MNNLAKMMGVAAIVAGSGVANMAVADAGTMNCGTFGMMEDQARLEAAHSLLVWIADTANFSRTGPLQRYFVAVESTKNDVRDTLRDAPDTGWTDHEMKIEIEAHCINVPLDSNIIERLRTHT